MVEENKAFVPSDSEDPPARPRDEGGLHAPPELRGWRKAWWWFDFIVLVNLARLRFIGILVVIGLIITQWDNLAAYYDKWTRPATKEASSDVEYFCPMHPSVIRDHPDRCPICFMPLSKRKKGSGVPEALPAGVVKRVQLSPYRMVLSGVQTWRVDYVPLTKNITAVGYVEFNERGQRTVSARVAGRIDKLFANETGQMVGAGDVLASLYSPDLLVTVQNLLDARHSGNNEYLENARTRLKLLGIDDAQLDEILSSNKANTDLRIRSPISGHVIKKYVREGQYVQEGSPLYDVADLSTVWIEAQIYEDDMPFLPADYEHGTKTAGTPGLTVSATTRAFPDHVFHGKLDFIYPHVDQETRTITVRFELDNPGHMLRPGSTATVTLKMRPKDLPSLFGKLKDERSKEMLAQDLVLAVPEGSLIDTGSQRIVYREASPGVFEGVEVVVGPRMTGAEGAKASIVGADFYPVLRGLKPGQRVVTTGSFLVDAETRLNPAAGSIYFGSGSQSDSSRATVRPSTPENPPTPDNPENVAAKVEVGLAALSPEDRALAAAQRFCPVLSQNHLGFMGAPIKVMIDGQPVFLCCQGCKKEALANPAKTLAIVKRLKEPFREQAPK